MEERLDITFITYFIDWLLSECIYNFYITGIKYFRLKFKIVQELQKFL